MYVYLNQKPWGPVFVNIKVQFTRCHNPHCVTAFHTHVTLLCFGCAAALQLVHAVVSTVLFGLWRLWSDKRFYKFFNIRKN